MSPGRAWGVQQEQRKHGVFCGEVGRMKVSGSSGSYLQPRAQDGLLTFTAFLLACVLQGWDLSSHPLPWEEAC